MHFTACRTFLCNGKMLRPGQRLEGEFSDAQLAQFLKKGLIEQQEGTNDPEEPEEPEAPPVKPPAKRRARKPKNTKPAQPAETK